MKQDPDKTFEITSEYTDAFKLTIRKGKVIWCSDSTHPYGSDWKSLKDYYENRPNIKYEIKEVKDEIE